MNQVPWSVTSYGYWKCMIVESLSEYINPPTCIHFRHGVVNMIWRCSPMSFKNVSLWCVFYDYDLTTHQSNWGVELRKATQYHPHTLTQNEWETSVPTQFLQLSSEPTKTWKPRLFTKPCSMFGRNALKWKSQEPSRSTFGASLHIRGRMQKSPSVIYAKLLIYRPYVLCTDQIRLPQCVSCSNRGTHIFLQ